MQTIKKVILRHFCTIGYQVYAFRGEKSKAYENLRMFNQRENMPLWIVELVKLDPLFESIRNETEFQQIVRDVESKY